MKGSATMLKILGFKSLSDRKNSSKPMCSLLIITPSPATKIMKKMPNSWNFDQVVNFSIVETLNRSFATSLTVLITLLSLYILGGQSIKFFVLALLIGILSGAYSSIFTASPILVMWEDRILESKKKE